MFVRRPVPLAVTLVTALASVVSAQQTTPPPAPASPQTAPAPPAAAQAAGPTITLDEAVRLALANNQTLRSQRLAIDISKADEVTAGLKPNPTLSLGLDALTVFTPSSLNWDFFKNNANESVALDYTFERGGKRGYRLLTAKDSTDVTTKGVNDNERQLRFNTISAFVNVQLAKSTLGLAQQDLTSYQRTVQTSRDRVTAGDLAEADFYQIDLQKLQFEQDVFTAELSLIQSKATLRQFLGYDNVPENFDVAGDLAHTKVSVTLDQLKQDALANRPDLQSAESSLKLANDSVDLAVSNRARDIDGHTDYNHDNFGPGNTLGFAVSFPLEIHDQNQGNIAHARIAVDQAKETVAAARIQVITDVESAFAQYQTNDKVLAVFESGYLNEAQQSLDIANFVFQRGAGSLLDLLNAERTYRQTELAYRQALAAYVTSLYQLNLVVGRQVVQ